MSSPLQNNITNLQSILDTINNLPSASAGGGLNFEVVGGITEPTNPKENTIWVNTDVEITRWYFSIEQPDNAINGMVWIETDDYSDNPFNAIIGNGLRVYPIFAKQYRNNSWQTMDAQIFQNNNWNSFWNGELFVSGNQYISITGGWDATGWTVPYGSARSAQSINSNGITITNNGVEDVLFGVFSGNKIDLRKFNTIVVTVSSSNTSNFCLIVNDKKQATTIGGFEDYPVLAYKSLGKGTKTLDISNIEFGYIAAYLWSTGGNFTATITDIHLE